MALRCLALSVIYSESIVTVVGFVMRLNDPGMITPVALVRGSPCITSQQLKRHVVPLSFSYHVAQFMPSSMTVS